MGERAGPATRSAWPIPGARPTGDCSGFGKILCLRHLERIEPFLRANGKGIVTFIEGKSRLLEKILPNAVRSLWMKADTLMTCAF